jgi:hypothetical protein
MIEDVKALRVAADEILIVHIEDADLADSDLLGLREELDKLLPGRSLILVGSYKFVIGEQE